MAKLETEYAHLVCKFRARRKDAEYLVALRSDAKVLRRLIRPVSSGYKIWGTLQDPSPETLEQVLWGRGYEDVTME